MCVDSASFWKGGREGGRCTGEDAAETGAVGGNAVAAGQDLHGGGAGWRAGLGGGDGVRARGGGEGEGEEGEGEAGVEVHFGGLGGGLFES